MNRRSIIITLLVALIAAIILWNAFDDEETIESGERTEMLIPDFTATGLETRVFESDGRLAQQIRAEHMAHFSALNLTELESPVYITYLNELAVDSAETGSVWEVSAEKGRYYEGERLELESNVLILNRSNTGYIDEIKTDFISIDLQNRTMHTDSPVTIQGIRFIVNGNGMRVDLEAQQLELIDHVETIYYPRSARP
ncbi:LPS export ABC transporter periplasmic protein LptC [Aliidiomarina shirensis]|uniref:LPS export ABC transporter periplasmic protein LptC n=1 Tax=Aliidiomarina shirensis TaxID=1048642 RepID=UPI00130076E6|nr:LPS export ABC transporter periplasmic protein LptC [Aliidiomarina shirensis]